MDEWDKSISYHAIPDNTIECVTLEGIQHASLHGLSCPNTLKRNQEIQYGCVL